MKRANRQSKAAIVGPAGKVLKGGKVPLPNTYRTGEPWLVDKIFYAAHNKRGQRRGGKVPLPGARSTPFGVARRLALASIGWSAKLFPRRTTKAEPPFTRCTTSAVSAAAARCRSRVRALRPSGSRGGWHWQALVGQQSYFRGVQLRPNRLLRGAQQARSAPRTNVRELLAFGK